jgi:hypothetical protein
MLAGTRTGGRGILPRRCRDPMRRWRRSWSGPGPVRRLGQLGHDKGSVQVLRRGGGRGPGGVLPGPGPPALL